MLEYFSQGRELKDQEIIKKRHCRLEPEIAWPNFVQGSPGADNSKMSFSGRTEYSCHVYTEKEYTSFKWNLPDFILLREYYKRVWACEFMITNEDTKCNLEFALGENDEKPTVTAAQTFQSFGSTVKNSVSISQPVEYAWIYLHFGRDKPFDRMKVIVSIIDGSGGKALSINQIRGHGEYKMRFRLIDCLTLFNPFMTSNYVHNDTLTILCEIINIKKQESTMIDTKKHVEHFSYEAQKKLQVYFEARTFCDVAFVVGTTIFHAHKVIVAANSPVLEAMFNTDMSEKNNNIVDITDTDDKTFEAFLKYIYTGSIAKMEELVGELLIIADKYQVMSLRNLCETHIADHLGKENAIEYLLLAYFHNFKTLKGKALAFVRSCQQEIVDSAEFKKLCTYPDLVSEIFRKPI